MADVNLLLPLPLADQIAQYVLACPTPPGVGATVAYNIVEQLKGLDQAQDQDNGACEPDSSREPKGEQPAVGPTEIL